MGGYLQLEGTSSSPMLTNEHISLDLSQLHKDNKEEDVDGDIYFSKWNASQLEWKRLSNAYQATGISIHPTARLGTTSLSSEKAYIIYGGIKYDANNEIVVPEDLFMKYNILNDTWFALPPFSTTHEVFKTSIVNIGNDIIWKYGGIPVFNETLVGDVYALFNYKNLTWSNLILNNMQPPQMEMFFTAQHTTTLVRDGIYRLGGSNAAGYLEGSNLYRYYESLNNINIFNTTTMKWTILMAEGFNPSRRDYHTTTYLPDKNLLLIFGGVNVLNQDITMLEKDNYVIYNITSNTYMETEEPSDFPFPKERYGHYATLYKSKYLLLMFGGTRNKELSDIINVVNITDPLKPTYIANINNRSIHDGQTTNANNRLSTTTLIVVIVIAIAVFLVLVITMLYYLKRKMKKKKENIQLEKEDPRKSILVMKAPDLTKPNRNDDENVKIQYENQTLKNDDQLPMDIIKPSQVILCKAYENQYEEKTLYMCEKTEKAIKNESQLSTLNSNDINLKSSSPSTDTQVSSIEICKPSISENLK
ncbi:unnamed protein product [Cunninghamella blakesleeana]